MTAPEPIVEDLVLLFAALSTTTQAHVTATIAQAGFGDLRPSDGFVVQHLQHGPVSISDLADKLGITAQGVSKTVIEMERKGYVTRTASSGDQRKRLVELTSRGWDAIHASRRARADLNRQLRATLGPGARAFLDQVHQLAETTGAMAALTERRLRP
nr:MarR family transcriptional regulator [Kibdelosporangium sp. MJ126-NF4]CEL13686.1 Transcriptional regulator, MarR family [Kibdelosporangium sp. MJ126-NF4]CTQ99372.1 Transcriptional regulator, MarR family [Kibdelosporangium sp. MJ126-NF4]